MIKFTHVDGQNAGEIILYALSTCAWCQKTKRLLDSLQLAYDFVDVDLLTGQESEEADQAVTKWNSSATYPTIVIDNKRVINGFKEEKIRELTK